MYISLASASPDHPWARRRSDGRPHSGQASASAAQGQASGRGPPVVGFVVAAAVVFKLASSIRHRQHG